jgi:hypothetical protein
MNATHDPFADFRLMPLKLEPDMDSDPADCVEKTAAEAKLCDVKLDEVTVTAPLDEDAMRPGPADVESSASSTPVSDSTAVPLRTTTGVVSKSAAVLKVNPVNDSVPPVPVANAYAIEFTFSWGMTLQSDRESDALVHRKSDERAPAFELSGGGDASTRESGSRNSSAWNTEAADVAMSASPSPVAGLTTSGVSATLPETV